MTALLRRLATVLLCAALGAGAAARAQAPAHEAIEWLDIWLDHAEQHDLPQVLLIGDSITRGYYPFVSKALAGKAHVSRLSGSRCVGDPILLEQLRLVLAHNHFDVIHFNNGMHGWDDSDAFYARGFPEYLATIQGLAGGAKLIWASTTPVRVAGHLDELDPKTERVRVRNAAAARLVAAAGIPIDDLFSLVLNHPAYWSPKGGGVHYTQEGYAVEGRQVAAAILHALNPSSSR